MALAYATGVPATQQAFLQALVDFAVLQGWTQDEFDAGNKRCAIHKGTVYVQFRWDAAAATGGIGLYQSLGFTPGLTPGNHPGDSGNGQTAANPISSHRRMPQIGDGPFTNYFFFSGDSPTDYIHAVLEVSAGVYRHISFGTVKKFGTWTGGEYASSLVWSLSSNQADILATQHFVLFDALGYTAVGDTGTLHMEGLPGEAGASKWGCFCNNTPAVIGNDRAGNGRYCLMGCLRQGPLNGIFQTMSANPSNGYIPLQPIWVIYRNRTPTPEEHYFLGCVPNMRFVNIKNLEPAEEIIIGAETWKVFPWVKKQYLGGTNVESKNMGIAIRKA